MTIQEAQARDKITDHIVIEIQAQLAELWPSVLAAIASNDKRETRLTISIPLAEDDGAWALEVKTKLATKAPKAESETIRIN